MTKNIILWIVIAVVLISVFNSFSPPQTVSRQLSYSQFIDDVRSGQVQEVTIKDRQIYGKTSTGDDFITYSPGDPGLVGDLLDNGVTIKARPPEQQSVLMQIFISWFPMLLLIAVWIFFMRQMQGGGSGRGASYYSSLFQEISPFHLASSVC